MQAICWQYVLMHWESEISTLNQVASLNVQTSGQIIP